MRPTTALITLAFTAALATPAIAAQGPVNETEFAKDVDHSDLDLTTRKGVSVLDDRVRTRIKQMCRNGGRDSASIRLERQCRASALASAKSEVRFAIAKANADRVRLAANTTPKASDAAPGA